MSLATLRRAALLLVAVCPSLACAGGAHAQLQSWPGSQRSCHELWPVQVSDLEAEVQRLQGELAQHEAELQLAQQEVQAADNNERQARLALRDVKHKEVRPASRAQRAVRGGAHCAAQISCPATCYKAEVLPRRDT